MRKIVLAASLFGAVNVGAVEVTPYIVNGTDISALKYPSFVSLFYDRLDYDRTYGVGPFCGATLLDEQHVLTAAHCVYGDKGTQLFMSAVPQLLDETNFPHQVMQRVMVNEYYYPDTYNDDTLTDDIAILKLASPITAVNSYAEFVPLTNIADYRKETEEFFAVGHGNTQSGNDATTKLQDTQLTFVPNRNCNIYSNTDTSNNLCMTGADTVVYDNATCQGDSGGPLYWDGKQVGVTSFGPTTCGQTNITPNSIFTEVARHEDWIQSVLSGEENPKVTVSDVDRYKYLGLPIPPSLKVSEGTEDSGSTAEINAGTTNSTNTVTAASQSGSGGGSLGLAMLSILGLLSFRRKATTK